MTTGTRDPQGVLVVDKPAGPTSHDVVGWVRRALGTRRVGHTGTLDPAATGVLVCAVGRATRLVDVLQAGHKTYAATAVLGITTDSQDADGEVVATTDASHLTEQQVCEVMAQFIGDIEQVPPMVSAVKVGGRRLHELAREGIEVERQPRRVTVHDLVVEDWEPGEHPRVSFLVTCSAGTYVRTLAHDLGRVLDVGGSLTALRRVANGPFTVDQAVAMDELDALADRGVLRERLLSPAAATAHLPRLVADDDTARRLTHGQRRAVADVEGVVNGDGPVSVVGARGRLVGIFAVRDGVLHPQVVLGRPEDWPAQARADEPPDGSDEADPGAADG